ncbi:peptidase U32 family protein [Clostridium botulinum]|uniref:Peptidase, U32 family n=1 Tax=Clostridium botulinum (strain Langeland / NCTC 10281 / Type F) TaxID=441772 RepID=A7GGE2_CLOBL|nr:U32 family peptidase [Clostridium botulinum]ABS40057.1 peptidase, U32 family [Clostridium botulinum F str. Langeland]MBY6793939.1 U32 family peptidase [Clostridium botulinum]MBY6937544.1 U32 family peptidase [Clostridium botulinum]MBY6946228.1 U32 family peptidase [Clostridium botulinum]NEZ52243.1 U32 family peptidase [Clostridium botulinum F str. Langeland]
MLNMKKPELLAPAGNLEKLKTAINFGADAVYLGGSRLNLRAFADNFTDDELQEGIKYAHDRGRKVHVTINVFPRNEDFDGLEEYLKKLYEFNVDAIIVSDPGIIMTARETVPNLEIHLSTQANTVNFKTINFWYKQGVKRTVLARELTLEEIKTIREKIEKDCELEAFVHGSMCMSYSGRCLLSNYMTGRDSNRGACAQPCRYKYYLMEEKREGEYFPILEDDKGTYIMNSKDMCMIEHIPELVQGGIDSFKIEGRMKSSFYVATVVKAYREAIDAYFEDPENYTFKERWMDYLKKASHRAYFTGFYFNDPNKQLHESSSYIRTCDIVGIVKKFNEETMEAIVEQRNKVLDGDELEVLRPEGPIFKINIINMRDKNDKKIDSAPSAQMVFKVNTDKSLKENDILIKNK